MSDSDKRNKIIQEVTNDALASKFIQDVGQKAIVEREQVSGEYTDQVREVLADIGRDLQRIDKVPKGMEYVGSMSVHVYRSVILKQACFFSLNNISGLQPDLADGALRDLNGSVKAYYGARRQKLRSGF